MATNLTTQVRNIATVTTAQDQHVVDGYGAGAVDYLHKPVNPTILRSKVAVFAELYRQGRELEDANRALLAEVIQRGRAEEQLRSLTQRVMQEQEAERGRVALDLDENITQLLLVALLRGRAMEDGRSGLDRAATAEAMALSHLLGKTAGEVERISHSLRPSVLRELGLIGVLHNIGTEFEKRTGVAVEFDCVELTERLPGDIELAFYRILEEALRNVEQHACARQVKLSLARQDAFVRLAIHDDGVGFDLQDLATREGRPSGLGLLSMKLRAIDVGGILEVKSVGRAGTEIDVRIPLSPSALLTS